MITSISETPEEVTRREKRLESKRAYRLANREKIRARAKVYTKKYAKEHPERVKEYRTRYNEKNREKLRADSREYDAIHREKRRESAKRRREQYPEKHREKTRLWLARKIAEGPKGFYVYGWKQINGDKYYVGKGTGRRAYATHNGIGNRNEFIVEILKEGLTEERAFDLEETVISLLRSKSLLNKVLHVRVLRFPKKIRCTECLDA